MLSNLNFWAALLGLSGTILIFLYGIPRRITEKGTVFLCVGEDKRMKKKVKSLNNLAE